MGMTTEVYDNLGKGFIKLLDDDEIAVLSIGMLPHEKFTHFVDMYFTIYAEKLNEIGARYEGWGVELIKSSFTQKFKSRTEFELSCAVYRNANMVV